MIKYTKFYSIILICFLLGFMVSIELKTSQDNLKTSTQYQRIEKLSDMLLRTEQERDELKVEVVRLKEDNNVHNEFPQKVNFLAGTTAVKGPGVVLSIEDSKKNISSTDNTNLYIIHDEDVLKVINELRAAGAEAISLNDQRLISTSEIRCAGPTISVNNTRVAAPFVIKAIGNAKSMEDAINMRGGVAESLSVWGIKIDIKKDNNIVIPAYKGATEFKYVTSISP
ncbi:DUF881 domain-containing protein [uncultured Megamonas sp.]|uniref:DUF881 domain-containing protein n=1 Tax=uncultured Megamonas sp. TaxID=286140 RepID=UPI0025EC802B|nr:DUF881 domain-containing protein [uncultured Megamonas sp.]